MRVTLLSNGHGEDVVGSLLAWAFLALEPTLTVQAFPTVGTGRAYEPLEIPVLGPRRALPSGGLMLHSLNAFRDDLRAGFVPMTLAQLRTLRRLRTDVLVVVGDLYALTLGNLVRTPNRFYVQTLVSSRHHSGSERPAGAQLNRYFMERFSPPERLLMRRTVRHSYVRDGLTAALLARSGLPVSALGNPMLDALTPGEPLELPFIQSLTRPVVALLPGTRAYQSAALETMLGALTHLPGATGLVAWAGPEPDGRWARVGPNAPEVWRSGPHYLLRGRFADVLHAADLVLSTAGTATEQAAALGRPVVAFPVPPSYTAAFLANQRRLLGDALTPTSAEPAALAAALQALWADAGRYGAAAAAGRARLGPAGGSAARAGAILRRLSGAGASGVEETK